MDTSKSLAELTGTDWGPPPPAASSLIQERHVFRRTPLKNLTDNALMRLLDIGCEYEFLIPLALQRLTITPEAIGLLCSVLAVESFDWRLQPQLVECVRDRVSAALNDTAQINDDWERLSSDATIYRFYSGFERRLSAV